MVGAALVVAGLAVPATAEANSLLMMQRDLRDQIGVAYWGDGSTENVTVGVNGRGVPALTGNEPGAQRITVTDPQDGYSDFSALSPAAVPGQRNCHADSPHSGHCDSDWVQQAGWQTSQCNYPPGCTGPGATGLLRWLNMELRGTTMSLRDVPGDMPIPWSVGARTGGGAHNVELWSAESLNYVASADSSDHVVLHLGVGASTLSLGPGDDTANTRNGATDTVNCGDGNDSVQADAGDGVAADCETVTTS
jgi:hypothetical protein